jgi:hypothetical protein
MFTRWATQFSTATNFLGIVRGLATGVRPLLRYARERNSAANPASRAAG